MKRQVESVVDDLKSRIKLPDMFFTCGTNTEKLGVDKGV